MSAPLVHVALLPSAGMGHLTPFLRVAALLVNHHCRVTIITPQTTVSLAESKLISRFQSAFPQVTFLQFHLLPFDPATANSTDPFFLRFESIRRSAHLLSPLLASLSPPLSALICDMTLISSVISITESLRLPIFIFFTSSAMMLSFFSYLPRIRESIYGVDVVEIPGISPIPRSSIPPLLLVPDNVFGNIMKEDSPKLPRSHGILINTFEGLEPKSLEALNSGKVVKELPPVFAIGPFVPCEFEKDEQGRSPTMKWLDDQPTGSVVYVSFGSRLSMGREQIREIGNGLIKSGFRFLWVVKDKMVDKEDEEGLDEVVGVEVMERLKETGLVIKEWVDQKEILDHRAVGGFLSHCGWNSVTEAAWHGVPILGWPQIGDQKVNAEVVERSGWGIWKKSWGWAGEVVVKGKEIGDAISEMMKNESLKIKAEEIKEAARKAISADGSSEVAVQRVIDAWKKNIKST